MENYSVLMSVYYKEEAEFLRLSIESVMHQTVKPNDFVLVCDGPLTEELDAVIADAAAQYGPLLQILRLEKNQGLKHALNAGLPLCKNELIARMDSDDVCAEKRCELQLKCFAEHPELAYHCFLCSDCFIYEAKVAAFCHEGIVRTFRRHILSNHWASHGCIPSSSQQ